MKYLVLISFLKIFNQLLNPNQKVEMMLKPPNHPLFKQQVVKVQLKNQKVSWDHKMLRHQVCKVKLLKTLVRLLHPKLKYVK